MFLSWLFGTAEIFQRLSHIERQLDDIHRVLIKEEAIPMVRVSFDQLREQIEHSTTVQKSAVELIRGLADKIAEIGTHPTPEEMAELSNQLRAHAGELANAIALHEGQPDEPEEEKDDDEEDHEERHR